MLLEDLVKAIDLYLLFVGLFSIPIEEALILEKLSFFSVLRWVMNKSLRIKGYR